MPQEQKITLTNDPAKNKTKKSGKKEQKAIATDTRVTPFTESDHCVIRVVMFQLSEAGQGAS